MEAEELTEVAIERYFVENGDNIFNPNTGSTLFLVLNEKYFNYRKYIFGALACEWNLRLHKNYRIYTKNYRKIKRYCSGKPSHKTLKRIGDDKKHVDNYYKILNGVGISMLCQDLQIPPSDK